MQAHPSTTEPQQLSESIPVIEEQLEVTTRTQPSGAVRVRIEGEHVDQAVTLAHVRLDYEAQRVPRGITVTSPRAPWAEGDVWVVPVYEEVEVIERRLVLKEEIRLIPRVNRSTSEVDVPLRKERVVVERQQPDGSWQEVDGSASSAQPGGSNQA